MSGDFHIHTNASWCAAAEMTPAAVAAAAGALGLAEIGLSDHLWLDAARGSRPAVARLLARRREPAGGAGGPAVRLGAEADCAPGLGIAGGAELAALDYVIAADHFSDLRQGVAPWPDSPETLAGRLAAGLLAAAGAPHATILGHMGYLPARVAGKMPWLGPGGMASVYELALPLATPALAEAARRGVAVELNAKALGPRSRALLLPWFRRARELGCAFTFASDAHRLADVGRQRLLADYARAAGISAPG